MRGSPLLQVAMVFAAVLVAGVPVWTVTNRKPPTVPNRPSSAEPSTSGREITLLVETSSPSDVTLELEGRVLKTRTFPVPPEGADLVVRGTTPGTNRVAIRVAAEADGDTLAEKTFWGNGHIAGVLQIPPEDR